MAGSSIRRICVFCGSRVGARPGYLDHARALGELLAEQGIGPVYGGAQVGLMGALADAVRQAGGEVIGVIPQALVDKEIAHLGLSELHVVSGMHERKAKMAQLADAFVAMPGGYGTLEELFEVTTWAQLGLHRKPIGLLNSEGYYDALLAFLQRAMHEGFVAPQHLHLLLVDDDAPRLLDALAAFEPPPLGNKWIGPAET